MDGVGATTMRRTTSKPLRRRISNAVMTALAVFVTIWPLFITGYWVYSTFIYQPRPVVALSALSEPKDLKVFDEPIVSITFDDGWESAYRYGAPVLQKYGLPSTQFIISGVSDDLGYMSKEQILSLKKAGHDIESHTVTHPDLKTLDDGDLDAQLVNSRDQLSALTGGPIKGFAAPYDSYGPREMAVIKKYYSYHRNTYADARRFSLDDINTHQHFDRYNIAGYSTKNTTTASDISKYLEYGKQHNAWIVLIYHEVSPTSTGMYNTKPQEFDAEMQAVKRSGIKVATVTTVMENYDKETGK